MEIGRSPRVSVLKICLRICFQLLLCFQLYGILSLVRVSGFRPKVLSFRLGTDAIQGTLLVPNAGSPLVEYGWE